MTTLLDAYEADTIASINETLEINGYSKHADPDRIASAAADKRAQVADILANGLDIGGIVRHVIPVTLEKNDKHDWVFVRQTKEWHGEMFYVSTFVN